MEMHPANECIELPFASCVAVTRRACLFVWRNGAFTRWLPISHVEWTVDDSGARDWRVGDTGVVNVSRWLFQQAPELRIVAMWDHPPLGWCAHCSDKLVDPAMIECGRCHDRVVLAAERAKKIVPLHRGADDESIIDFIRQLPREDDAPPFDFEPPRRIEPRRNRLEIAATMRKRGLSVIKSAKSSR
jgi:hypothetical protein